MAIPTEPIGSIPRPAQLIQAGNDLAAGRITAEDYARLAGAAVRETIELILRCQGHWQTIVERFRNAGL